MPTSTDETPIEQTATAEVSLNDVLNYAEYKIGVLERSIIRHAQPHEIPTLRCLRDEFVELKGRILKGDFA